MKKVLFEVLSARSALGRIVTEFHENTYPDYARVTFESPESMARTLTPTRWGILQVITGAGEIGVREIARKTSRDVKGVHTDLTALVDAGVVDRTRNGKYIFPFEQIAVSFELRKAA